MRIRSTRFGTPLNLLAIGNQAFSIPYVICQVFSCPEHVISSFCLLILFHYVKCAKIKGFCVVFNSRSYLIHISWHLFQLQFSRTLFVPTDAESGCRTHGGRICWICWLHSCTLVGIYYAATILKRTGLYVLPRGTGWYGMQYQLCFRCRTHHRQWPQGGDGHKRPTGPEAGRINRRQIEHCFCHDVILCGWLGSKY